MRILFKPLPSFDTENTAYLLHRISLKVKKVGKCWLWQGNNVRGYGRIDFGGKKHSVNRLVYSLCVGVIEAGLEVCHNCPKGDNPSCCNPEHLWIGTHTENMQDSEAKGRNSHPGMKGEKHPMAVLSDKQVLYVRSCVAKGKWGIQKQLAEELGVSQACISEIVNYRKRKGDYNGSEQLGLFE